MGTIQHRAMIIMPHSEENVEKFYNWTKNLLGEEFEQHLSPIFKASNGYDSFYIAPDGSKNGWNRSSKMIELKERIKDALLSEARIIEIEWGELGNNIYFNDGRK